MAYFPDSTQFDEMNVKLGQIAAAVGGQVDVSTWAGVQRAVRMGIAPNLFPVGTQMTVNHSVYGNKLWDVVAHNYFKSIHDENAYSMTLLSHDLLASLQFDSPEAFYYAESALAAGTYNFTLASAYSSWAAGTYQFTLANQLPAGGQLTISGYADAAMTTRKVYAFSSRTATTKTEECVITSGNDGTSLGTFGTELNHAQRVSYGSNNYKESAVRQLLNSNGAAGSFWTPQTKFDRPPSWLASSAGFMGGLDNDFLAVVGDVVVKCSANNTYEAPDSTVTKNTAYTVSDKFCLASCKEIFGTNQDVDDSSVQFPFYTGATDADRKKYLNGSAASWWLRTPYSGNAYHVRVVGSSGVVNSVTAHYSYALAPACTIV
jgi:hypothetical protein